jgi:hypothetical protein
VSQKLNYVVEKGPGILREQDLASCGHCQMQMAVKPATHGQIISRLLPPCHGCGKFICNVCMAAQRCDPWEKKMERAEAKARLRSAILGG